MKDKLILFVACGVQSVEALCGWKPPNSIVGMSARYWPLAVRKSSGINHVLPARRKWWNYWSFSKSKFTISLKEFRGLSLFSWQVTCASKVVKDWLPWQKRKNWGIHPNKLELFRSNKKEKDPGLLTFHSSILQLQCPHPSTHGVQFRAGLCKKILTISVETHRASNETRDFSRARDFLRVSKNKFCNFHTIKGTKLEAVAPFCTGHHTHTLVQERDWCYVLNSGVKSVREIFVSKKQRDLSSVEFHQSMGRDIQFAWLASLHCFRALVLQVRAESKFYMYSLQPRFCQQSQVWPVLFVIHCGGAIIFQLEILVMKSISQRRIGKYYFGSWKMKLRGSFSSIGWNVDNSRRRGLLRNSNFEFKRGSCFVMAVWHCRCNHTTSLPQKKCLLLMTAALWLLRTATAVVELMDGTP